MLKINVSLTNRLHEHERFCLIKTSTESRFLLLTPTQEFEFISTCVWNLGLFCWNEDICKFFLFYINFLDCSNNSRDECFNQEFTNLAGTNLNI